MGEQEKEPTAKRRQKGRSPAYPSFSIGTALDRVRSLYEAEGLYATPVAAATQAWGYSPKSSGGRQALATLKYYGLIDVIGEGDGRMIKLSDRAKSIVLDEREESPDRHKQIRDAALEPKVHGALFSKYRAGLPSDSNIKHFLVLELGFQPEAADDLIKEFKNTAAEAKLFEPGETPVEPDLSRDAPDSSQARDLKKPSIGDLIQWTSGGVDQLPGGARVVGFSEDRQWVFTKKGTTGIPVAEVSVMESKAKETPSPPPNPYFQDTREERPPHSGDRERAHESDLSILVSGKLRDGFFEVRTKGEVTAREVKKIVAMLQAQIVILQDDEENND